MLVSQSEAMAGGRSWAWDGFLLSAHLRTPKTLLIGELRSELEAKSCRYDTKLNGLVGTCRYTSHGSRLRSDSMFYRNRHGQREIQLRLRLRLPDPWRDWRCSCRVTR